MPAGLKQSSSTVAIGFQVTESAPNVFTQDSVDLNLQERANATGYCRKELIKCLKDTNGFLPKAGNLRSKILNRVTSLFHSWGTSG